MSVNNNMAPTFGIFMRFDINHLENALEFHHGVTWRRKVFEMVFKMLCY